MMTLIPVTEETNSTVSKEEFTALVSHSSKTQFLSQNQIFHIFLI